MPLEGNKFKNWFMVYKQASVLQRCWFSVLIWEDSQKRRIKNLVDRKYIQIIVVLEKTLESPLHSKEIKPVNPKRNQPWIFIGRTDAEAKAPILWSPEANSQLTGKNPDAGKDRRQEKRATDEVVGWHHWLNGRKSGQTPGNSQEQGSLACCSSWSRKEPDMTERMKSSKQLVMWCTGEGPHVTIQSSGIMTQTPPSLLPCPPRPG